MQYKDMVLRMRHGMEYKTSIQITGTDPLQFTSHKKTYGLSKHYQKYAVWHKHCPGSDLNQIESIPLTYAKYRWLKHAIELNPFKAEYFYWIDSEIGRFFSNMDDEAVLYNDVSLFHHLVPFKISIQKQQSYRDKHEIRDTLHTGLFGGNKHIITYISNTMLMYIYNAISSNNVCYDDEKVMTGLYMHNRSMFYIISRSDFRHGHCNVICI
jgi:hypothetical protein